VIVEALVALLGITLVAWALRADDVWFQIHMMRRYCVVDEAALPRAHAARWILATVGVLLALVARPRLGRRVAGRSFASLFGPALRIAAAVLLAFVAVEIFLRVRGVRPADVPYKPPEVDLPASASRAHVVDGRTVHYATNPFGFRARTTEDMPDLDLPTIVFIGESIAFGYGLDHDETIPALVSARTGIQTVNLAVSGSGNDEALLRLKARLPRFSHPIAVVAFVVYTQIDRNVAGYRARLALTPSGSLEEIPEGSPFLRGSPLRAVLRAAVPYRDDEAIELTRAILRETAAYARSRNASPLMVLTGRGTHCLPSGERPWVANRLTEDQPFPSIDVDVDDSLALGRDIHPNPRGAQHYAEEIEKALRAAGVVHR
jgi:hypothetical protein